MFKPLSLYIGLRYTRAKRRDHFISFISLASMIGIALGVAVLITVLSVMNGFDFEIRNRLFTLADQVSVTSLKGMVDNDPALIQKIAQQKEVIAVAPYVRAQGLLTYGGSSQPVMVTGIDPALESHVSKMNTYLQNGSFNSLQPKSFGIAIGAGLAESLGLGLGDKVILLTPQASATPLGVMPRFKSFTVTGIFHVEGNTGGLDQSMAYINMQDAQALYQLGNKLSGLRLRISDLYAAPKVSMEVDKVLPEDYIASNWTQEYTVFFKSIRMEKTMIFLILLMIIAVATFNLVSSLVMVVNSKQADIAILRTFGATPGMIMATFIVQGSVVGLVGTLLGLIGGVALALNVTPVVNFIQAVFHVEFISTSVYFIDYLPSRLMAQDVWEICLIALGLSLLATLYPAWHASRTQPAEALRYE